MSLAECISPCQADQGSEGYCHQAFSEGWACSTVLFPEVTRHRRRGNNDNHHCSSDATWGWSVLKCSLIKVWAVGLNETVQNGLMLHIQRITRVQFHSSFLDGSTNVAGATLLQRSNTAVSEIEIVLSKHTKVPTALDFTKHDL